MGNKEEINIKTHICWDIFRVKVKAPRRNLSFAFWNMGTGLKKLSHIFSQLS